MKKESLAWIALAAALATVWVGGKSVVQPVKAQERAATATAATQVPVDELQRSNRIDSYYLVARDGAERGETLYYYKCWMCHNQYTVKAQYGDQAPFLHLKDLYQRQKLVSGQPVNDETVTAQLKNGSGGMPAFGSNMSDKDIADVVSYLKSGRCCVEGENPPKNPWYQAEARPWPVPTATSGGPRGLVQIPTGESPEGIMVQLIAPNNIRTTVYAREDGAFEFPALQSGNYTLRIAKPLEYKPYRRDAVAINGAMRLPDIVLERITKSENLPADPAVMSQLTGAELLWNLPGSMFEKKLFEQSCGCHAYKQVFRNRFDDRSWRLIVNRMTHYSAAPLINPGEGRMSDSENEELLVNWLIKVRGVQSKDLPVRPFPRPRGPSTRMVVTEYELPRVLLSAHDVHGDSQGNIWYTSHKSRFVGKLDPRTGVVTEYAVPLIPGAMPGTHRVWVDKNDIVWLSENWSHRLTRLDPKTGQFTQMLIESSRRINTPGLGNFAMAPDGTVWYTDRRPGGGGMVTQYDPSGGTARVVKQWPLTKVTNTYDNTISLDGRYWAGGSPAGPGHSIQVLDIESGKMLEVDTGAHLSIPARGGFDPEGNPWFGGRGGNLVMLDIRTGRMREFVPPLPYLPLTKFYEAMPDKNGEVWAGVNFGGGFVRLNPKTYHWTEYQLPEPFSYNRRTWIDNSTNPVTVWYIDYNGYIVRLQPLL
jgi:streptogramin lyase/cytochrome c5